MKLRILSDLHLDHRRGWFELEEVEHDVLVCAGDIRGNVADGIEVLGKMSERPAVFVGGNHEFYGFEGASLDEAYDEGRRRAGEAGDGGGTVYLLENEAVVIAGVRFLGTTLWTDYALYGDEKRDRAMEIARRSLNDHRLIRLREPSGESRAFEPADALALHLHARQWLSEALSAPFDGPTVVCTHHAPHRRSVAAQFDGDMLTAAFVSHIPELVEGPDAPNLWVHGHTHTAFDYRVGRCRVVCNPLGYLHERTGVDTGLVVEV